MLSFNIFLCLFIYANAVAVKNANSFKDQFCTDPRTMRKHAAYTEWADAYSCTRHRCQPGGRNLAIYTVGCKRVEAPESAIECEEVVEDTNMQFPYCCTRLRCLVVVRGEVWTRVLGQPWEVLPAAPWSHMYKMKRPPPSGEPFVSAKNTEQGPVYELAEQPEPSHKVSMRAGPDNNGRAHPDLVIALTTNDRKNKPRQKTKARADTETDDDAVLEKSLDTSQETFITGTNTPKPLQPESVPHMDWQSDDKKMIEPNVENDRDAKYHVTDDDEPKKEDHSPQLQTLVDAIGTRMRDIEGVVHRMNQGDDDEADSAEKRIRRQLNKEFVREDIEFYTRKKRPSPVAEYYRRFSGRRSGGTVSKYVHNAAVEVTSELPLYVEDNRLPGYYNDAENPVRRSDPEKDPTHPIYMAPIENQRRKMTRTNTEQSEEREVDKKRKRKLHKRKHTRGKKHRKEEKRRHTKKTKSGESSEDSGIAVY